MNLVERMMSSGGTSNDTMMIWEPFSTQMGGSMLWFNGWIPTTGPATFFACIGLFFLAAFSRFLEAFRLACLPPTSVDPRSRPNSPLIPEGVCAGLFVLYSAISYFLMLAVTQYNVWFFLAILIGLGSGEFGFGRYSQWLVMSRIRLSTSQTSEGYGAGYQFGKDG